MSAGEASPADIPTTSSTECRPDSPDSAKKGWRWKRTRHSQQQRQDSEQQRLKQADLDTLELAAQSGHIELKYLDEAGFCLYSPVSYSYSRVGHQKRLEQVPTRGSRISILGLWQPEQHFEYALAQGGFEGESYIKVMDWIADFLSSNTCSNRTIHGSRTRQLFDSST